MTTEQAIYQLTDLIKDRESFMVGDYDKSIYDRDKEALQTAITALEKQLPKKPLYRETEYYAHKFAKGIKAPFCECSRLAVDEENDCFTYCPDCGQALDWSDENE